MLGLGLSSSPPLLQGFGSTDLQAGKALVAGPWHGSGADVESELHSLRAAVDTSQRNLLQLENKLGARLEHICRRHVDDVMANSNPLQELKQGLLRVQSECRHLGLGAGRLPSARDIDDALERHRTALEERVSERIYNLERALSQQQQSALERLEGRGGETWRTCLHRMSQLEERAMLHTDLPRVMEQFMNEVRRSGPELLSAHGAANQQSIAELRAAWRRVEATVAGCEARLCGLSEESSAEGRVWRASVAAKMESMDRSHQELGSRLACCEAGQSAVENGAKRNLEAAQVAASEALERAEAAEKSVLQAKEDALRQSEEMIKESSETLEKRIRSRSESLRRDIEKMQLQLQADQRTLAACRQKAEEASQEGLAMGDKLASVRAEVEKLIAQVATIPGDAREASEKELARGLVGLRHELQVQVSKSVGKLEIGLNQLRSELVATGASCDGRIVANERRVADLAGGVARIEEASRIVMENMVAAAARPVHQPPAAAPATVAEPSYQPSAITAAQPVVGFGEPAYKPPTAAPVTAAGPPHQSPAAGPAAASGPPYQMPAYSAAPAAQPMPNRRQGTAEFGIQDFSAQSSDLSLNHGAEPAVARPPLMPESSPPAFGGGVEASIGEVPISAVSFDARTQAVSESQLPPAMSPGEILGDSGTLGDAASLSFGTHGLGEVTALGEATAIGEVTAVGEVAGEETALVPSALADSDFHGEPGREQPNDDANSWDSGDLPLEGPPAHRASTQEIESDDGGDLPDLGFGDSSALHQAGAPPPLSIIEQPMAHLGDAAAPARHAVVTEHEMVETPAATPAAAAPAAAAPAAAAPTGAAPTAAVPTAAVPTAAAPVAEESVTQSPVPAATPEATVEAPHQAPVAAPVAAAEEAYQPTAARPPGQHDAAELAMQESVQQPLTQEAESDDGDLLPDLGVDDSPTSPQAPALDPAAAAAMMDELGLGSQSDWDSGSFHDSGAGHSAPNTARTGVSGQSAVGAAAAAAISAPAAPETPVGIAGVATSAAPNAAPDPGVVGSEAAPHPEQMLSAPVAAAPPEASPPAAVTAAPGMGTTPAVAETAAAAGSVAFTPARSAAPKARFGIAGSLGALEEEQAPSQDFDDDQPLPADLGLEASMNSWDTGSPAGGSRSFDRSHNSFDAPAASPALAKAAPAAAKAKPALAAAKPTPTPAPKAAVPASARSVLSDLGFDSDEAPMEEDNSWD